MVNTFKGLLRLSVRIETKLKHAVKGSIDEASLKDAQELIDELKNYMYSYTWLYKQKAKEKIKCFIESGFDYEAFMDEFRLSSYQARNAVSWANRQFKKKIGENTLTLLNQGFIDEARAAFYASSGQCTLQDMVLKECYDKMPESKLCFYKLSDCELELRVLRIMSKANLDAYYNEVDMDHLAFLRYLLEGHSKRAELFRPYMVKLLMNELTVDELVAMEEEIERQIIY